LLLFSTNAVIKHRVPIYCCQNVQWPDGSIMGKNVSRSRSPLIFNLGTRCRQVVSFTPWQIYCWDSLNRRLGTT